MAIDIRYLQRHEIDIHKWNACIQNAGNGLLYANSWWLDGMSDNWCGLVCNNYEAVMPLTWKKKFGIRYLYQPWFVPSLGMFSQQDYNIHLNDFLAAIPVEYRYWDLDVNEYNAISGEDKKLTTSKRTNYIIPWKSYNDVYNSYSRLARRKMKKTVNMGVIISEMDNVEEIIKNYRDHYKDKHPAILDKDYRHLASCCRRAQQTGHVTCYTALSKDRHTVGFYLLLHDKKYTYSLLGGSTAEGKEVGVFYALTDRAISDAMQNKRSFRFEGSDIPGIAFFNQQFGPECIHYLHLVRNDLRFPFNVLKKYRDYSKKR